MKITISILMKARKFVSSTVTEKMVREIEYFSKNYKSLPLEEPRSNSSDADKASGSASASAEIFVVFLLFIVAIVGLIIF